MLEINDMLYIMILRNEILIFYKIYYMYVRGISRTEWICWLGTFVFVTDEVFEAKEELVKWEKQMAITVNTYIRVCYSVSVNKNCGL